MAVLGIEVVAALALSVVMLVRFVVDEISLLCDLPPAFGVEI